MPYKKGDLGKYFSVVIAALIVLAAAITTLIHSLLTDRPAYDEIEAVPYVEVENGVNPGTMVPSGPPMISEPSSPPPS